MDSSRRLRDHNDDDDDDNVFLFSEFHENQFHENLPTSSGISCSKETNVQTDGSQSVAGAVIGGSACG